MTVSNKVYESAVKGRSDFRKALKAERDKNKELLAALKLAYNTLSFIQDKAPGYDWNADPLSLTLKTGEVFETIELLMLRHKP